MQNRLFLYPVPKKYCLDLFVKGKKLSVTFTHKNWIRQRWFDEIWKTALRESWRYIFSHLLVSRLIYSCNNLAQSGEFCSLIGLSIVLFVVNSEKVKKSTYFADHHLREAAKSLKIINFFGSRCEWKKVFCRKEQRYPM